MAIHGDAQKSWAKVLAPIVLTVVLAGLSFVMGGVRAQSADATKWEEIKPDIQKIRAMPDPSNVVTKDQFIEVIKRLDDQTQEIRDDVKFLRQREEKRGH